jgi:O-antigen ligase
MALALTAASALLVGLGRLEGRFAAVRDEFLPGSQGRLSTWRASVEAMPGAWLTGWGFNTFPLAVSGWVMYPAAHNEYLQLLVETGITGVALALWAAWSALRAVRRDAWVLAAVSGALLHAFVEFGLEVPALSLLLACLAAWPAPNSPPGDRDQPV